MAVKKHKNPNPVLGKLSPTSNPLLKNDVTTLENETS